MSEGNDSFQRAFIDAIYHADAAQTSLAGLSAQIGFKVYRNTILKACVDALAANYPSVARLVGAQWFASAALLHVHVEPPDSVCLIEYGRDFPDFLRDFAPAAELPYLADVARLDRCWSESHIAADDTALTAQQLAALTPQRLLDSVLPLRASVRWHWSPDQPAYTIWRTNRQEQELVDELAWQGEGALFYRRDGQVVWQAASLGMCIFLDACANGCNLQTTAGLAVQAEPGLDVAVLLSTLINAEVFVSPV